MTMRESEWVESVAELLTSGRRRQLGGVQIRTGLRLAYGYEIVDHAEREARAETAWFETDFALIETSPEGKWKPRVVVEAKLGSITTHDAITYSHKASQHRAVYPYLRYGVMLGNRRHYPLPGRLYRHGANFDFMVSFVGYEVTRKERSRFVQLLVEEVEASRTMEKLLYESRKAGRDRYQILRRRLEVV
jgi:hypothetical protein